MIRVWLVCSLLFMALEADRQDSIPLEEDMEKIENAITKEQVQNWLEGRIGLKPHKVNYILPFGYRRGEYKSYTPEAQYKQAEAELQVSLKLNVGNNLLGLHEAYYASYSHQSFWQLYTDSSPFRETNYNPEIFVAFPVEDESLLGLRSITFGYSHLSNGQGNIENVVDTNLTGIPAELHKYVVNRSRSVNSLYGDFRIQHGSLVTDLRLWMPFTANGDLSDNPDLLDYTGFSSLKFRYFYGKSLYTLSGRMSFTTAKGALEGGYSYPIKEDLFLYIKLFSGYGESLIDYNNYITKASIGFSFSR
ncbi:MAG: phospholipase A [Epsilonproteobacteria bacterium]|nr:phospholipase A [Campylobacterota bacterium]